MLRGKLLKTAAARKVITAKNGIECTSTPLLRMIQGNLDRPRSPGQKSQTHPTAGSATSPQTPSSLFRALVNLAQVAFGRSVLRNTRHTLAKQSVPRSAFLYCPCGRLRQEVQWMATLLLPCSSEKHTITHNCALWYTVEPTKLSLLRAEYLKCIRARLRSPAICQQHLAV